MTVKEKNCIEHSSLLRVDAQKKKKGLLPVALQVRQLQKSKFSEMANHLSIRLMPTCESEVGE